MYDRQIVANNANFVNNSLQNINNFSDITRELFSVSPELLNFSDPIQTLKSIDDYDNFFSTQQIENIDFSNFENHVFFDSAVNKVNYTIKQILNFPYDKNELEYKRFINNLEGYTKYVYENLFPKSLGSALFSGNEKILIKNKSGSFLQNSNDDKFGILNTPNRFSFNFWININSNNNINNQIVFKLLDHDNISGYVCYVEIIGDKRYLNFLIVNESNFFEKKIEIEPDVYNNITINCSIINNKREISFLINGNIKDADDVSNSILIANEFNNSLNTVDVNFVLAGAENLSLNIDNNNIVFNNFIGEIDEFRLYNKIITNSYVKDNMHSNIFSQNGLLLYLKFNEPAGDYSNSCICLDYSGNKLHGAFFNSDNSLISDTSNNKNIVNLPMLLERDTLSPVRNSRYPDVISLHTRLINEASTYDQLNPNIIFNMLPKHYFLEAADFQKLPVFSKTDYITYKDNEFNNYQNANNHFVNLVLIWAKFFDQLKLYVDSISTIIDINYEKINDDKIFGIKIPLLCKMYGLKFSEIFGDITKRKQKSEALTYEDVINDLSIRKIQNKIWYKILINSRSLSTTKGTHNSIQQIMSLIGIENIENITIRESSSNNNLTNFNNKFSKQKKYINRIKLVDANLLNQKTNYSNNISSFSNNKPFIEINDLKHSEQILSKNNFISTAENVKNGLGQNFTIEYFFDFDKRINNDYRNIQNLFRIDLQDSPVLNAYFYKTNNESRLYNFSIDIKPFINTYSKNITLAIENIDVFTRENYICLTQNIEGNNLKYRLVYSKANSDHITDNLVIKESIIDISDQNIQNLFSTQQNTSIRTGEFYYDNTTSQLFALDNTLFEGNISCIRTWSKDLNEIEILNHAKNIFNTSEKNINKTFLINNFLYKYDNEVNVVQNVTNSSLEIKNRSNARKNDNSEFNNCYLKINNPDFNVKSLIKYDEIFVYNKNFDFNNIFDENKINISSFENNDLRIKANNFNNYPIFNTNESIDIENNNKFFIDFSITKNINNDINQLLTSLDDFDDILNNNSMYFYEYEKIKSIKKSYFNRLDTNKKINYTSLLNVFRYLDNIMSTLISGMLPSKTNFAGFNFVYESHILERNKYQHKNGDSRISLSNIEESFSFSREYNPSFRNKNYIKNRKMK